MELKYFVIAVCSLWFVPSNDGAPPLCSQPFYNIGNQCLFIDTLETGSFPNMKITCTAIPGVTGSVLAQINNATQLKLIIDYIHDNELNFDSFWIDGSDLKSEGNWIWGDGTPVPTDSIFWKYDCPDFIQRPSVNTTRNCLILDKTQYYLFSDVDCMRTVAAPICEIR